MIALLPFSLSSFKVSLKKPIASQPCENYQTTSHWMGNKSLELLQKLPTQRNVIYNLFFFETGWFKSQLQLFIFFFIFIQFLQVTFHLQLLQNIGCIPYIVQYILEPILHPPLPLYCPQPLVTTRLFYISVNLLLLLYSHLSYFLDSTYK